MPHKLIKSAIRMNLSRRTASALYCGLDMRLRAVPVPKPSVRLSIALGSPVNPNPQSLPETS